MKTPVFAVDVGYGNTKYAYRDASGNTTTGMFPSLSPVSARSLPATEEYPSDGLVAITIDAIEYEVGPDVRLSAAYGTTGRALADNYALTDNYAALLFGAIYFSGATHIECLVLGLPIHNRRKYIAMLTERFTGDFYFGTGHVVIDKVIVIAQALGSLMLMSGSGEQPEPDANHLIVDIGYFTTDWIYATGLEVDSRRSRGMAGGASQVYQHMAQLISRDEEEVIDDIERIDLALREKRPFPFYGKDIDLEPYAARATPLIENVVKAIQNNVGGLSEVRSLILSGGGAALYSTSIRRAFPRVRVELMESPCLANALGFLIAGEKTLARERLIS